MNALFTTLVFLVVLLAVGTTALFILLAWIAAGSPDVNGDPERDAGACDQEIEAASRCWDRGSHETATRPCLGHARRMNRSALEQSALTQTHP